jgi:thiamine pyrophosphokinase
LWPDAPKMLLILPRAALDITVQTLLKENAKWPVRKR